MTSRTSAAWRRLISCCCASTSCPPRACTASTWSGFPSCQSLTRPPTSSWWAARPTSGETRSAGPPFTGLAASLSHPTWRSRSADRWRPSCTWRRRPGSPGHLLQPPSSWQPRLAEASSPDSPPSCPPLPL